MEKWHLVRLRVQKDTGDNLKAGGSNPSPASKKIKIMFGGLNKPPYFCKTIKTRDKIIKMNTVSNISTSSSTYYEESEINRLVVGRICSV